MPAIRQDAPRALRPSPRKRQHIPQRSILYKIHCYGAFLQRYGAFSQRCGAFLQRYGAFLQRCGAFFSLHLASTLEAYGRFELK